jgi:hypothetical protein
VSFNPILFVPNPKIDSGLTNFHQFRSLQMGFFGNNLTTSGGTHVPADTATGNGNNDMGMNNPGEGSNTALPGGRDAIIETAIAQANKDIDEAVDFVNAGLTLGDPGQPIGPTEKKTYTKEERRAMNSAIAKRQKKLGDEELRKQYAGVIVIPRQVTLYDPAVASSALRFLGAFDRAVFLLNRYGNQFFTDKEAEAMRESLLNPVEKYLTEAEASLEQARLLTNQVKEKMLAPDEDWLDTKYTTPTFQYEVSVKVKETLRFIRALSTWEQAILEFAALEFNDSGSIGQISTMRGHERRLVSAVHIMSVRTIRGVQRRRNKFAQAANQAAEGAAPSPQGEAAAA